MEEFENIIALADEEGNEVNFEFLDLIEYQGLEYVVLLPVDDNDESVVILQVETLDDETEVYNSVESEEVIQAVFKIFKEKFKDEFNFAD